MAASPVIMYKDQEIGNSDGERHNNSCVSPLILNVLHVIRVRRKSTGEAVQILIFGLDQDHSASIRDLSISNNFAC